MVYKASLDTKAKTITVFIFLLFTYLGYKSIIGIQHSQDLKTTLIHSGILLLFCCIFLGCYLFAPKSYRIDNTSLTIVRTISDKKIMLTDIQEVRTVEDGEMGAGIRTFGVGGLFGYYGRFSLQKAGNVILYASQTINNIFIRTNQGKQLIITPDDKDGFIQELKAKLSEL
ncbi:MAG TPA: PH domain-containing protein [Sphingobacteriaceae bacterium]